MTDGLANMPEIRNEAKELRLLLEVCQALDKGPEVADCLDAALALMTKYTGMMHGSLSLVDSANRGRMVEAAFGPGAGPKAGSGRKAIVEKVIASASPVVALNGVSEPQVVGKARPLALQKEDIAFFGVPVLVYGQAAGALAADRLFADSVCPDEDVRLLQVVAAIIARAVRLKREFREQHRAVVEENRKLHTLLHSKFDAARLVGHSSPMKAVLEELQQVSPTDKTVLIRGESGTGKELVAGQIHANSLRSGKPFVRASCAGLAEGLVESELFGHEYSVGAGSRKGRFEMANSGTLYLDEVGDLTLETQAKLLRLVRFGEFERVGGMETLRVDVRLIVASSRDLETMVNKGRILHDLYTRLSAHSVVLPPLRERKEDISTLLANCIDKYRRESGRRIVRLTQRASDAFVAYHWPGNIRELENIVARSVVLCGNDGVMDMHHLPASLQGGDGQNPSVTNLDDALAALEQRLIIEALEEARGNMSRAAQSLGITERIMGLRMRKYDLNFRDFRQPA